MDEAEWFKAWRSADDSHVHLICRFGKFDELPPSIRQLGPWQGASEGPLSRLKPHYRYLVVEQGFVVVHRHLKDFEPEIR